MLKNQNKVSLEKKLGIGPFRLLTLICLFMVMQNRVMKYMTRIGQKTGMLKKSKKVQKNAIRVAFVAEYQNLNSGRRL